MPTSSEMVAKKKAAEAWDAYMAQIRASEAAKTQNPAPEPETPAEQPPEPSNG